MKNKCGWQIVLEEDDRLSDCSRQKFELEFLRMTGTTLLDFKRGAELKCENDETTWTKCGYRVSICQAWQFFVLEKKFKNDRIVC